jgi:two-component SAPR family response regulator
VAFLDVYLSSSPNGIELAEKLRAIDPEINIIIMSAHWSTADRVRDAGFGELLRKPFTLEEASARLGE